jgi:hypothetical protein
MHNEEQGLHFVVPPVLFTSDGRARCNCLQFDGCTAPGSTSFPNRLFVLFLSPVVLKLFWFATHCKTYKNLLAHFVYKIKNILIFLNYE